MMELAARATDARTVPGAFVPHKGRGILIGSSLKKEICRNRCQARRKAQPCRVAWRALV